jgi:hypothetical protein
LPVDAALAIVDGVMAQCHASVSRRSLSSVAKRWEESVSDHITAQKMN